MIRDKLQIYLITYNRKEHLKKTFKQIFDELSPIKDFDITVLDNCSTDGTSELIQEYCKNYTNLKHVRHSVNIGGNANIARAFEMAVSCGKEYFWVLCDDDKFNFSNWSELEQIINKTPDAIVVERKFRIRKNTLTQDVINTASFVPGIIYKTSNLTSQVIQNMYCNIYTGFPHLMLICSLVNNNKTFVIGPRLLLQNVNHGFKRGCNKEIHFRQKNMNIHVGIVNTLQNIQNKDLRGLCCKDIWLGQTFFKAMMQINKEYEMQSYNLTDVFWGVNFWQKIQFLIAHIFVKLSPINYRYWNIQDKEDWITYFKKVNEQKYLNKLANKLKNKKVVIYGAGMVSNIIFESYDMSKFNIVGICDKKFEKSDIENWHGYRTLKLNDAIKEADVIVVALKAFNAMEYKFRVKKKLNLEIFSLIKRSLRCPIGTLKKYNKTIAQLKRKSYISKYKKLNNRRKVIHSDLSLIGKEFKFLR